METSTGRKGPDRFVTPYLHTMNNHVAKHIATPQIMLFSTSTFTSTPYSRASKRRDISFYNVVDVTTCRGVANSSDVDRHALAWIA